MFLEDNFSLARVPILACAEDGGYRDESISLLLVFALLRYANAENESCHEEVNSLKPDFTLLVSASAGHRGYHKKALHHLNRT